MEVLAKEAVAFVQPDRRFWITNAFTKVVRFLGVVALQTRNAEAERTAVMVFALARMDKRG